MNNWSKTSWQQYASEQLPVYSDKPQLLQVIAQLEELPPLVTPLEIAALKTKIASAQQGHCFLLQGGDCAEQFSECKETIITNKFKILLQMGLILLHGLQKPIISVGRIAGQYAKPRSQLFETQQNITLPSYRGDIINEAEFDVGKRQPCPQKMLAGYHFSALTINYLRALVDGGFADLNHPEYWELDYGTTGSLHQAFQQIAAHMRNSLTTVGVDRMDLYTSHEALLLYYEQALTRYVAEENKWYNLSTHFPWIGRRTAKLQQAHIEYMRGIANPIAVKIGSDMPITELLKILDTLNPGNEAGKMTLIHRFGTNDIQSFLPKLIHAIQQSQHTVLWSCDPMHGNTQMTTKGIKTRHFEDILSELRLAFAIHQQMGAPLGGLHFEMTGENVTECIGGSMGITEQHLSKSYKSLVDPRLNYEQALEVALMIANKDYA